MSKPPREVPEPLASVARSWAVGGHVEDAVEVAEELSAVYWRYPDNQRTYAAAIHTVAARRKIPPVPERTDSGSELFEATVRTLRAHYYFESEWHYVLVALFVLQAQIVSVLPAVFYLFFGGRFGTGKTNILTVIAQLTGGIMLENVSVTALARMIEHGKVVCIDEFDVHRGREVDEIRDALVRQGYKASAAPYTRWDASSREIEPVPIYGPKAIAFRGAIDDALQSRGFLIPTATPLGEAAYSLVLRNLFPELGAIPVRANLWGSRAIVEFSPERVQKLAESEGFRQKVNAVVQELGANRESELMTVALLTAEIAEVDVLKTLKAASEQREASAAESGDEAIAELGEVVTDLARAAPRSLGDADGPLSLKQTVILKELNTRRHANGKPPVGSQRMASCRREIGVKDGWLRNVHKASWWVLPREFVGGLEKTFTGATLASVGSPTPPGPPSRHTEKGESGDLGDHVSRPYARPQLPSPSDTEDLFGGRPTRADLARERLGVR